MTPAISADVRRHPRRTVPRTPALLRRSSHPAAAPDPALPQAPPSVPAELCESTLGALAAEAVRLLRRRLGRLGRRSSRPPRVPGAGGLPPYRLVLLVLTALVSLSLAWLVSSAALDHRLRLAQASETGVAPVEVSLEQRDAARRLVADGGSTSDGHRARSGQPGTARGGVERETAPPSAGGSGGGLEIGGPVLAVLVGGVTLGAGGVLGLLVVRGARRRSTVADDDDAAADREDVAGAEDDRPEPGEDRTPDGKAATERPPSPEVDSSPVAHADGLAAEPAPAEPQEAGAPAEGDAVLEEPRTRAAARGVRVLEPDHGLDPALAAARQRLYEKRRAPRIPVDLAAHLTWLGSGWPVTVVELSEGGLRLSAPVRPSIDGRRSPLSAGDHVRLCLAGSSGEVRVAGRLAWQRNGPAGFEAGLQLITPSGEDLERLQELCTVAALAASLTKAEPTRV